MDLMLGGTILRYQDDVDRSDAVDREGGGVVDGECDGVADVHSGFVAEVGVVVEKGVTVGE